jgi:hypothetical protein
VAGANLGLRDILAALQWLRHNIAAFGGDPSRVTVLGHDTGAALVNLLLISSAAKGNLDGLFYSALNVHQVRALAALPLGRNTRKRSSKSVVLQGPVIDTPALRCGGPEFEYRPTDQLSQWRLILALLSHSIKS